MGALVGEAHQFTMMTCENKRNFYYAIKYCMVSLYIGACCYMLIVFHRSGCVGEMM